MESRRRKAWGWVVERSTQGENRLATYLLGRYVGPDLVDAQRHQGGPPKHPIHPSNTYATETPVVDERGVYVFVGASGTLAAVGHDGQRLLATRIGSLSNQ